MTAKIKEITLIEIIDNINEYKIDAKFITKLEKTYSCKLNDFVKKIICINETKEIKRCVKKIDNETILNANEEMMYDFLGKNLIPIFYCCSSDVICYNHKENIWIAKSIKSKNLLAKNENILRLLYDEKEL